MQTSNEQGSDLKRLMAAIQDEYEAALRGLGGLAQGSARHDFINARMEHIGDLHEQMQNMVGEGEATRLMTEALEMTSEPVKVPTEYLQR